MKIKRVSVVQQIADNLKEYIQSDEISIGQKLPTEATLCAEYGVSRGTIREAFCLLQSSGMVELRPGRGAFVVNKQQGEMAIEEWLKSNATKMWDIVEIRTALEPLAARMMALRCTDDQIAHLQRIHERFLKAVENNNIEEAAKHDARFHSYIAEKSGNELLQALSRYLNRAIEMYCSMTYLLPGHLEGAIMPHIEIARAIRNRDAEASEAAMRDHVRYTNESLKDAFNSFERACAESNSTLSRE